MSEANVFYFEKQPAEERTVGVKIGGWMEIQRGESVVELTAETTLDGVPVEGVLVSHALDGDTIKVRLKGGESKQQYKTTVLAHTDAGHVREIDIFMYVEDK